MPPADGVPGPSGDIGVAVSDYGHGLRSELALLHHLDGLSRTQHDAAVAQDLAALARVSADRDETMRAIAEIEGRIAPVRGLIAAGLETARGCRGFPALVASHRQAEALVAAIVERDRCTMGLLEDGDDARRVAAHAIETGGATLAAYRKVIAPPPSSADLVSRRG